MQVNSKSVVDCESPKCNACEFGKGHCRSYKLNTTKKNPIMEKDLNKDNLIPGKMVSTYHYIFQAPSRIYHTNSNSYPYEMFSGRYVFIDHAGYKIIKDQVSINSTETGS